MASYLVTCVTYDFILRIDNSRHSRIHVLWNISETTIAIKSCDISYERAIFPVYCGAGFMFYLKKRVTFLYFFKHFFSKVYKIKTKT